MKNARDLVFVLCATFLIVLFLRLKSRYDWSGPRDSAPGRVISCTSRYDSDRGLVYATTYSFADEKGSSWQNTTTALHFCLSPGSALKVEWPRGHPELSRAEVKK